MGLAVLTLDGEDLLGTDAAERVDGEVAGLLPEVGERIQVVESEAGRVFGVERPEVARRLVVGAVVV